MISVRCDAVTKTGKQCSKPAYEPTQSDHGPVWLCEIHRRNYMGLRQRVRVILAAENGRRVTIERTG